MHNTRESKLDTWDFDEVFICTRRWYPHGSSEFREDKIGSQIVTSPDNADMFSNSHLKRHNTPRSPAHPPIAQIFQRAIRAQGHSSVNESIICHRFCGS